MQHVEPGTDRYVADERADRPWPLSRVRWGAVLSGAVTLLSISLLLWGLTFAIVSLAVHPSAASMRGSGLALWIAAMASTVLGAVAGGWFAGRSITPAPRWWGAAHGFATWGVSLLLAFGFQLFILRGLATVAVLHSAGLDESSAEAPGTRGATESADAWRARDFSVAAGWSWFGTWFIAGIGAVVAGAAGAASPGERRKVVRRTSSSERDPESEGHGSSMTPARAP